MKLNRRKMREARRLRKEMDEFNRSRIVRQEGSWFLCWFSGGMGFAAFEEGRRGFLLVRGGNWLLSRTAYREFTRLQARERAA